jgi:diaminopimelate decarboxylase
MIDERIALFPATSACDNKGHLLIGGCDVIQLASVYGTPLYIFDESTIRQQCQRFMSAFKAQYNHGVVIAYAAKAFINVALAGIIADEGLGLDVVSGGEITIAQKANFPMEKVILHGNNKSLDEINMAIRSGVGRIVVDNFDEIKLLERLAAMSGDAVSILLRVNPGVDPHTHQYLTTGAVTSKFGFPIAQIEEAVKEILSASYLNLRGLHFHIGSGISEVEPYLKAIDIIIELAATLRSKYGLKIEELDIGGGFAVRYTLDQPVPDINTYAKSISERITTRCKELGLEMPELILEPGRAIVGRAGVALYTIGMTKEIPPFKRYIFIDGGMGDNIRPALYSARYEAVVANKLQDKSTQKVSIAGRYCESGDILIDGVLLPPVNTDDVIAVPAAGAYCLPLSSNYNAVPRPAIVMVSNGKANLIRRREIYEDLTAHDEIVNDV